MRRSWRKDSLHLRIAPRPPGKLNPCHRSEKSAPGHPRPGGFASRRAKLPKGPPQDDRSKMRKKNGDRATNTARCATGHRATRQYVQAAMESHRELPTTVEEYARVEGRRADTPGRVAVALSRRP